MTRKAIGLLILIITFSVKAQDFIGTWNGTLSLGKRGSLRLVLNISDDMKATLDSPDQGAYGIGCEFTHDNDNIQISVPKLSMTYTGCCHNDTISGNFKQGFVSLPLEFYRKTVANDTNVNGNKPKPYTEIEVSVSNMEGSSTLAGTLTVPHQFVNGVTPVAILVSGSGLQNRDEELFGHKPFADIAHYLATNGVATLRYDDRGFGESTGPVENATTADFASDAKAVLDWLRTQSEYQFGKAGIIGHSEGGQIAYMLGAAAGGPDYIVSIAGPVVKGTRTIAYQNKIALIRDSLEIYADDFGKAIEKAMEFKLANPSVHDISNEKLSEIYPQWSDSNWNRMLATNILNYIVSDESNAWMNYFLAYDPSGDVCKLIIPTFIIYGEKDTQVPPFLNCELAMVLAPNARVKVYPGLNHLMQPAVTGYVDEYALIKDSFSPEVMEDILEFIIKL